MKHSRRCFIGYPHTSNLVKNTPLRVVFSTLVSVFGNVFITLLFYFFYFIINRVCHTLETFRAKLSLSVPVPVLN